MVDYLRGLVHKIERENEELRFVTTKKDFFYNMNTPEEAINDKLTYSKNDENLKIGAHDVKIDKDDCFI
jgi:hypothetical protein